MRDPHFIPMTTPRTPANAEHLHLTESIRRPAIEASAISSSSAHAERQTPGATNKQTNSTSTSTSTIRELPPVAIAAVGLDRQLQDGIPTPLATRLALRCGESVRGPRCTPGTPGRHGSHSTTSNCNRGCSPTTERAAGWEGESLWVGGRG